jgi:hypothetical protein
LAQRRRFSAAGGAKQRENFAMLDFEGQVVDRDKRAE